MSNQYYFFGTRTFFIRTVPKIFGRVNGALNASMDIHSFVAVFVIAKTGGVLTYNACGHGLKKLCRVFSAYLTLLVRVLKEEKTCFWIPSILSLD